MNFVSLLQELLCWKSNQECTYLTRAIKTWISVKIYAMYFENILTVFFGPVKIKFQRSTNLGPGHVSTWVRPRIFALSSWPGPRLILVQAKILYPKKYSSLFPQSVSVGR